MWQSFLLSLTWLPMNVWYDTFHFNSQLTAWVGVNKSVHVGKEDKLVKWHYVTSSQKWSHTSCMLSCSLVYCIFGLSNVIQDIEQCGRWERNRSGGGINARREVGNYQPTWTVCIRVSYKILHGWSCMTMCTGIIQLTSWVGVNGSVHVGKEDKVVKWHYYVTSSQKPSVVCYHAHWSIAYLACQMLDRTWNSVGHGRETEVGGWDKGIKREMGNLHGWRDGVSY